MRDPLTRMFEMPKKRTTANSSILKLSEAAELTLKLLPRARPDPHRGEGGRSSVIIRNKALKSVVFLRSLAKFGGRGRGKVAQRPRRSRPEFCDCEDAAATVFLS